MTQENSKWDLINGLDFSSVKEKLKSKKGFWWKLKNDVNQLEKEYKQFLYLAASNPNEVVVPWTQHLDDFWHEHILDTQKYEKDCLAIFGKMFHHNPHLPVGSTSQVKAFNKTKEMYKESFGDKAKSKSSESSSDPGCGGVFTPVFCAGASVIHSDSSHSSHDSGSHSSHSDSGHSSGHSCGGSSGASCGGGSSCGSSCGGGGGCGGGGD